MPDTHNYPTKLVLGKDLNDTHVLVGESGGLSAVYENDVSSAMPGSQAVLTEHGPLYLDSDHEYLVYDEED